MTYDDFIASLDSASFPPALDSIHAYLHRVEGDERNGIYWLGNMPAISLSFVAAIKYVYS